MLTGYNSMSELHLRQPRFTYSFCEPFSKHCERIKIFKGTDDLNQIYKNQLDEACFVHDAAYVNSKDVAKRTVSGKVLKDRAY